MYPGGGEELVLGPFQVGALRILIAGAVLLPIAIKFKKYLTRKTLGLLLVVGLFGSLMPAMMFTLAETGISSSLAGLVNMATSFFVVIIGVVFYKSKPTAFQLIGLALGSTGLFFVLSNQSDISASTDIRYAFFLFPATVGYAVSLTTIKFKLNQLPSLAITSLSFMLILGPALLIVIFTDAVSPIFSHPDGLKAIGYLSILAVLGTAVAVMLFTKLIAISNHIFSSAIAYMLPVVAIFIGVLDGESFAMINLVWVAIIITGVFLMNRPVRIKPENSPQNNVKEP